MYNRATCIRADTKLRRDIVANINLQSSSALSRAFYTIFRKLVKIAIHRGLQYPEAEALLKHAYIDSVRDNAKLPGEDKVPDSRILAKTGISRRDLKACAERAERMQLGLEKWSYSNRLAQIVKAWQSESDYLDDDDFPALITKRGKSPSLQDLVERHSGGLTPRAVLDELIASDTIEVVSGNKLRLRKTEYYVAGGDDEDQINRQADTLKEMASNLIDTMSHNFNQKTDDTKYYQAQLNPRVLPEDIAQEFEVGVSNALHDVLKEWHVWCDKKVKEYLEKQEAIDEGISVSGAPNKQRVKVRNVGAGAYFIHKTLE